jgi:hypothetical protein
MIWCLGMYASGSTWLFNTTREVARAVAPEQRVTACYAETLKMLKPVKSGGGIKIVKTHQLPLPASHYMNRHAAEILLTVRDPRDAVVSLTGHMGESLRDAMDLVEASAMFCQLHAGDGRSRMLKYEDGFVDDPATLDMLAGLFGSGLDAAVREALFNGSRRAAIEAKIAKLEALPTTFINIKSGDVVDLDTQWHRHHANRTGEVGRWQRLLAPEAARRIERRLGGWMRDFGYEV